MIQCKSCVGLKELDGLPVETKVIEPAPRRPHVKTGREPIGPADPVRYLEVQRLERRMLARQLTR